MTQNPRRRILLVLLLVPVLGAGACSDDDREPADGSSQDAAPEGTKGLDLGPDIGPDTGPPACGNGNRPMPKGLTELSWDSGKVSSNVRAQSWTITSDGKKYALATEALSQAVRFELKHPAKVYGFSVQWANIAKGTAGSTKLTAGLFRDFGHNGFDYWEKEPLWSGTRCVEHVTDGKWLHYVFDKPITVEQPGLVYVAQRADKATEPVFAFDDKRAKDGKCDKFDLCHSSINLPNAGNIPTNGISYNGLSFSFSYNFMVRLHVSYTSQIKDADRIFQKQSGVTAKNSSVSWGDYDNDGWDDLLVGGVLYRNNQGTFTDVTTSSGITAMKASATGGIWGDYDNDGCLDLFLFSESMTRADTLARGDCKGTFTDVTAAAKIVDQQNYNSCGDAKNVRAPTAAAAWIDLDADGLLDLYLANFICWSGNSFYRDTVFRNKGDGTFEEWTGKNGFSLSTTASRVVAPVDHDGDGDLDLFVGNYRLQANLFFQNDGKGKVSAEAQNVNLAGNSRFFAGNYYYGHTIGAAWGDLDNDGDFDLVVGNLAHPRFFHFSDRSQVLINDGKGNYKDKSGGWAKPYGNPTGLRYQETHSVPLLGDFDNDGKLDLAITCIYDGRPTDFYWGKGDGTFSLDVHSTGITTTNGWGIAASDYDRDGDLDLYATGLFNNSRKSAGSDHWLQVRVVGTKLVNRAAIGATVKVKTAGGKTFTRQVQGGTGKGCQNSLYLHFGLGSATSASEINVTFPGGKAVKFSGPFTADKRVWVYEDGTSKVGWTPK